MLCISFCPEEDFSFFDSDCLQMIDCGVLVYSDRKIAMHENDYILLLLFDSFEPKYSVNVCSLCSL